MNPWLPPLAFSALFASSTALAAPLGISPFFSPGMVLQRDMPVTLTGQGPENGKVKATLGKASAFATISADGAWKVELPALPAGGPHVLEVSDGTTTVKVGDILSGDVWVCSGQSNMQMGLDEAKGGTALIAKAAKDTNLRLLVMPKAGSDSPQIDPENKWKPASADSLRKFSAVGAFFAAHLREEASLAKVPLGIIDTSFGGTAIEAWMPKGTLPAIPEEQISGSMFGIAPGNLYNKMIAPLTAGKVKGVLWYQGEANAGHPTVYDKLLGNLAKQWRKSWSQPELPFFIVQLPAFEGRMGDHDFGWLREAEAKACKDTPGMHLAVTYDTTDGMDLHPVEKEEIGRRVSLLARKEAYGNKALVASGPAPTAVSVSGKEITVTFDQAVKAADGGTLTGFAIAGADGDYRFAKATASGNKVILEAEGVPSPKTLRYAFGAMPDANLVNSAGLPAAPFRTDTFEPSSLAFQPQPVSRRLAGKNYQITTGTQGTITGLIAGGKQFLSAEPDGGTRIPGGFGTRGLPDFRMLAPDRVEFSDRELKFEVACKETTMEWTLKNEGKDPVELQIALGPQVKISGTAPEIRLARDGHTIRLTGVDRVEAERIFFKVNGKDRAVLEWKLAE